MAIPLAGVLVPILKLLPVGEWWFWLSLVIGSRVVARALRGPSQRVEQLEAELKQLRAQLDSAQAAQRQVPSPPRGGQTLQSQALPSGVAVILFTDIEGFTSLVDRYGDEESRSLLVQHHRIVRRCVQAHGGTEIKQLGDSFMVSFASAKKALLCAADIQQKLDQFNDTTGHELRVRIGLHAGEPLREGDGFVGQTVNLTERIMDQAVGGQVFVSEVVRNLAGQLKGFQYVDQGLRKLAGIAEPQRLYAFQRVEALSYPLDSNVERRLDSLEERLKRADGDHPS